MSDSDSAGEDGLLYGVAAIATFLGIKPRQVLCLVEKDRVRPFV